MTTTPATLRSRAERFRAQAETLAEKIEDLRRTRLENTPKRALQGMQARLDAANLERTRAAMLALADAYEAGTIPAELAGLSTRAQVEPMVSKCCESTSYYHVHEGKDYRENSPTARRLREWLELCKTDGDREREAKTAEALKVAQLEREVRFSDIPGFFPTPPAVIARMMEECRPEPGLWALEPSAGKGDILAALKGAGMIAVGFEINWTLADICKAKGLKCERQDFTDIVAEPIVDRVVMNPPFENRQDAHHIERAYLWLKPGGRLVALASAAVEFSDRYQAFRDWLSEVGATVERLPSGSFIDAFKSTGVEVVMIVIEKPALS